jgi:hypothetical protein
MLTLGQKETHPQDYPFFQKAKWLLGGAGIPIIVWYPKEALGQGYKDLCSSLAGYLRATSIMGGL